MILASGAWQMGMSVAQSEATGREIAKALNMPYPLHHADLIHIPADALLAAQTAAVEGCNAGHMPYQPVIEGELLTDHPATLLHKGAAKGVSALIAYHEEEEAFFALVMPKLYKSVDRRDCLEKVSLRPLWSSGHI
jgi:carboxylesterase type B